MLAIDFGEFNRAAAAFGDAAQNQVPFALARALNDGVKAARTVLIQDTWPTHVKVRNPNFLRTALSTKFASKKDLSVAIFDQTPDQRAHLKLHAEGGVKAARGGRLAIAGRRVPKGAHGVTASLRPANLKGKIVKGDVIYQQVGRGKNRHLKLLYILKSSVRQPKDVPFYEDFAYVMRQQLRTSFASRLREALATARRR